MINGTTQILGGTKNFRAFLNTFGYIVNEKNKETLYDAYSCLKKKKVGVMLQGKYGAGKTMFFNLYNTYCKMNHYNTIIKLHCPNILYQFMNNNSEKITPQNIINTCANYDEEVIFDDLGKESQYNYFGNTINYMKEIINIRYERFKTLGHITHFTTNLTQKQIEEKYGGEIESRLCEMCNTYILLSPLAKDMRKVNG